MTSHGISNSVSRVILSTGLAVWVVLWSSSCSHAPVHENHEILACEQFFEQLDHSIEKHALRDGQNPPVGQRYWLRSNRLLTALATNNSITPGNDPENPDRDRALLNEMANLALQDYQIELDRLDQLGRPSGDDPFSIDRIVACQQLLLDHSIDDPLEELRPRNEYSSIQRFFGLYPLTQLFVMGGVNRLHQSVQQDFAMPLADLAVTGQLQRWAPDLESASHLGTGYDIQLQQLLSRHAPVIEIDMASGDDLPGAPFRNDGGQLEFDDQRPLMFVHSSQTLFEDQRLQQLVYVMWFAARTPEGKVDLLSGRLDGITWRVTLDSDGQVLIYDVMHNCGCYHMFFPADRLIRNARKDSGEPPLIPAQAPQLRPGGRIHLRLAAGNHYLQRVWQQVPQGAENAYALRPYDDLRRGGLFPPDGIIAESKRAEWITLWPMGIPAPGAMRQWGRHATAFVGRRYFDEPFLIERYFARVPESDELP